MSFSFATLSLSIAGGAVVGHWIGRTEQGSPIVHCHCAVQDSSVAVAASGAGYWWLVVFVVVLILVVAVYYRIWAFRVCAGFSHTAVVSRHDGSTSTAVTSAVVEEIVVARPKRPSDRLF
jgi:hypothetical protein